jgi:protein-disulfide isomerase
MHVDISGLAWRRVLAAAVLTLLALSSPVSAAESAADPTAAPLPDVDPLPDMSLGQQTAPINIIEYASMTCPHCAHFDEVVFPELKKNYIDTGKVYYVFREFPLDGVALRASMVARCMDKSHFFDFIHTLFRTQAVWATPEIWNDEKKSLDDKMTPMATVAKEQGNLSRAQFDKCVTDDTLRAQIALQAQRGSDVFNVPGTPAVYIDGRLFAQSSSYEALDAYLKDLSNENRPAAGH